MEILQDKLYTFKSKKSSEEIFYILVCITYHFSDSSRLQLNFPIKHGLHISTSFFFVLSFQVGQNPWHIKLCLFKFWCYISAQIQQDFQNEIKNLFGKVPTKQDVKGNNCCSGNISDHSYLARGITPLAYCLTINFPILLLILVSLSVIFQVSLLTVSWLNSSDSYDSKTKSLFFVRV